MATLDNIAVVLPGPPINVPANSSGPDQANLDNLVPEDELVRTGEAELTEISDLLGEVTTLLEEEVNGLRHSSHTGP